MNLKKFFTLGSVKQLAKLVKKSVSTIYRWKREGIPNKVKDSVQKILKKPKKKKEPTTVPLTTREKHERKYQKELAIQEQRRIRFLVNEDIWEKEYVLQEYTPNRIIAISTAIKVNRGKLKNAKGKRKKRLQLALDIAKQMLVDFAEGHEYVDPEIEQPLVDEFNLDRDEAYRDIYGYE